MPLGKYYCDYCDKQFQDTPTARRRHLKGTAHQRAKALWYDAVRSSSHFAVNEVEDPLFMAKGVCNWFVRTGSCQYGDSCKYYHPKKNVPNLNTQGAEAAVLFGNQMGTSLGNLPPSLWPPPDGGYPPLSFVDWG
ncbi:C2H2 and C2HC zinc fingers superfamily protein [Striga hermonthica]|uniref:C2H2 and C2HC zinc fingers superfamily protein n=1 Tax=Striga hermonthica TaxID=68872 RepID=A0A9N7N1T3_STRHE|nr:C2H2 and C2HC zinc fingers superfamily protein [Striga hermonthica]